MHSQRLAPRPPAVALGALVVAVAAEALVQVKVAALGPARAVPELQVAEPVGGDVDERGDGADGQPREDHDDPDLAGVEQLAHVADQAARVGRQHAQALALLGVLKDPVNGREVVVADAAAGAFDVPVQRRRGGPSSSVFVDHQPAACGARSRSRRRRCRKGRGSGGRGSWRRHPVAAAVAAAAAARQRREQPARAGEERGLRLALERNGRRRIIVVDWVVVEHVAGVVAVFVVVVVIIAAAEEVELVSVVGRECGRELRG